MLTVKFMTYNGPRRRPTSTSECVLKCADEVYISFDKHGRTVVRIHTPKGVMDDYTVGSPERNDVMFHACYVMNDAGKTVETIR